MEELMSAVGFMSLKTKPQAKSKLEKLTGMTASEFDCALTKAVGAAGAEAVREHHRAGRSTYGLVGGVMGKLNPDGSFEPKKTNKKNHREIG